MNHSIWASVIEQYSKELAAKMRQIGGAIRQNFELHRTRDAVIVGAAAILTFVAFSFFIIQTVNAVTATSPSRSMGDVMFMGS